LGTIQSASQADFDQAVDAADRAFMGRWREVPAPRRGEIVRRLGEAFRQRKEDLASAAPARGASSCSAASQTNS
jgi:aldehyde dehydrogenase (NAD+)